MRNFKKGPKIKGQQARGMTKYAKGNTTSAGYPLGIIPFLQYIQVQVRIRFTFI